MAANAGKQWRTSPNALNLTIKTRLGAVRSMSVEAGSIT